MEEEFYKEFLYGKHYGPLSPIIENENWLNALLENTLASIMILKAIRGNDGLIVDFEYLYVNKKAEDSINRSDLKGKRYLQEYPESIIFGLFQKYVDVTETGISWEDVIHLKNVDTWKSIKAVKLDDGCLIMFSDITAQKKAEQELKESREFLQSVIDLSLTGLSVFRSIRDESGHIHDFEWILANRKTEQLSGSIQLNGKKFSEVFYSFRESDLFERYVTIVENDVIQDFEVYLSEDVKGRWYHILARKLDDGLISSAEDITERKKTETELLQIKDELARRAQDKYLGLFNNMNQGFCIIEIVFNREGEPSDYIFREVNPSFERHSFLKDIIGKKASEVFPGIDLKWTKIFGNVALTGIPVHFEDHSANLNNAWFDVNAFRLDDNGNKQVAVLFTNITERKKAEEIYFKRLEDEVKSRTAELNESKNFIEEITKVSPDLIIIHEVDTNRIIFTNSENITTGEYFILSEEKRLKSRIHPGDHEKAIRFFNKRKSLNDGEIIEVELRNRVKKREWGWIRERSKVFRRDANGKVSQIITFASDITFHKTAELKIREQSRLIQRITDTTPDLMYVIDMNKRRIIFISNNIIQMLGYEPAEIYRLKRNCFRTIVHPDDFPRVIEQIDNLVTIKHEEVRETEFRLRDFHLNIRWLNVRYTLFESSEEGKVRQVLAVGQDITAKKKAEEAYNEEHSRNIELTRMNELMDTFVFAAAHDLKAPISNLKLLTSVIENSKDNEIKCNLLKKYNPIIENLEGTISGLIRVLEIEKTTGECIRKLYFENVLHSIIHEQHEKITESEPELDYDFSACPSITYTESYLASIFRNMITNSIKYKSPERNLVINIKTTYSGSCILLSFSDNGIGIDLEAYGNDMFKPFKRFSSQSTGSGIGLHLIKSIVTKNGGNIEVESEIGKGTTFKIYLVENRRETKC
jgi:PAS domain S-box-containing protein